MFLSLTFCWKLIANTTFPKTRHNNISWHYFRTAFTSLCILFWIKKIIAKAIDCPWDNGSVLERMRLYGNLPNFPWHISVSENFSKKEHLTQHLKFFQQFHPRWMRLCENGRPQVTIWNEQVDGPRGYVIRPTKVSNQFC